MEQEEIELQIAKEKKRKKRIRMYAFIGGGVAFVILMIMLFSNGNDKGSDMPCPPTVTSVKGKSNANGWPIISPARIEVGNPCKFIYRTVDAGKKENMRWQIYDSKGKPMGKSLKGNSVQHRFSLPGTYTIKSSLSKQIPTKNGVVINCISAIYEFTVIAITKPDPAPGFAIRNEKETYRKNEEIAFSKISPSHNNILWEFDDGSTSSEPEPKHRFKKDGEYMVTLKNLKNSKQTSRKIVVNTSGKGSEPNKPAGKCRSTEFVNGPEAIGLIKGEGCIPPSYGLSAYEMIMDVKKCISLEDLMIVAQEDGLDVTIAIYEESQGGMKQALLTTDNTVNSGNSPISLRVQLKPGKYKLKLIVTGDGKIGTYPQYASCAYLKTRGELVEITYPGGMAFVTNLRIRY